MYHHCIHQRRQEGGHWGMLRLFKGYVVRLELWVFTLCWWGEFTSDGSHSSQSIRSSHISKSISDPRQNFGGSGVNPKVRRSCAIPILLPYKWDRTTPLLMNYGYTFIGYSDFSSDFPGKIVSLVSYDKGIVFCGRKRWLEYPYWQGLIFFHVTPLMYSPPRFLWERCIMAGPEVWYGLPFKCLFWIVGLHLGGKSWCILAFKWMKLGRCSHF